MSDPIWNPTCETCPYCNPDAPGYVSCRYDAPRATTDPNATNSWAEWPVMKTPALGSWCRHHPARQTQVQP